MEAKKRDDIYKLWQECFGDSKEYMDYYMKWRVGNNKVFTFYEGNVLASMLHLNPYKLWVNGKEKSAHYIVGVATSPMYRKRGLMRKLLTSSLEEMYKEGEEFTYLMPAHKDIYLPFDFRYVYKQDRIHIEVEKELLSLVNKENYDIIFIGRESRKEQEIYLEHIVTFANEQLKDSFNIVTVRDYHYYKRLLTEMKSAGGDIVVVWHNKQVVASLPFMAEGNQVEIVESIISSHYSKDTFSLIVNLFSKKIIKDNLTVINDIDNQEDIDEVQLRASEIEIDEKSIGKLTFLESFFINKKELEHVDLLYQVEQHPVIMARIVHFENFIKEIKSIEKIILFIEVKDNIIKENEGLYELVFTESGCEIKNVYKGDQVSANVSDVISSHIPIDLSLDIADLTSLLFGAIDLDKVLEQNNQPMDKNLLDQWEKLKLYKSLYVNEIV